MSRQGFKRASLRAPLNREVIYLCDQYPQKAMALNISEGGILLANLPEPPAVKLIHLIIELPLFPDFYSLNPKQLLELKREDFDCLVIRARARIAREFKGLSMVEQVFAHNIGCEFMDTGGEYRKSINDYIARISRNTVFLLNLFESASKKVDQVALIRNLSVLFGHQCDEKMFLLRQKILHDYHSLES